MYDSKCLHLLLPTISNNLNSSVLIHVMLILCIRLFAHPLNTLHTSNSLGNFRKIIVSKCVCRNKHSLLWSELNWSILWLILLILKFLQNDDVRSTEYMVNWTDLWKRNNHRAFKSTSILFIEYPSMNQANPLYESVGI